MRPSLLKAERKRRGWSQAEIAEILGVTVRTVRRWEQELAVPQPPYRKQLIALFDKTAQELGLLSDTDESEMTQEVLPVYNEYCENDADNVQIIPRSASHSDYLPQAHKPLPPTLWLAFALSGVVLLIGTLMPFFFLPLPGSNRPHPTPPIVPRVTNPAIRAQPTIQSTPMVSTVQSTPMATVQDSLTGSYAEQPGDIYNLTAEGTLDWIDWGLNAPGDVNHKRDVQQQIHSFTLIGNGTLERDTQYPNAYTWSDGTPVMVSPSQQQAGVYVRGVGNGFTFSTLASTTPRTLRVYVGAAHAQGKLWVSIGGKTFTDASLDMRNDPNVEDNGIYTLVFSSSVPNQLLTVNYTVQASDKNNGYVMLEAATLQ